MKKHVAVFCLSDSSERRDYEAILNDPDAAVTDKQFAYLKNGDAMVTIEYVTEIDE